jgi:hypothetical protein
MYQIHLRTQASKLAALAERWQLARIQQRTATESRQHRSYLRAALAKLTNLATLRVMPGNSSDTAERHDPRNPRNW